MAAAKRDGIYEIDGIRFKARAGETLPEGVSLVPLESDEAESSDGPRWYQRLVAKAAEKGEAAPERLPDEGEAAFKARIAATPPAPSETTQSTGPAETL